MATYTIRGESYLGKRTGPKIVFGVAKIAPRSEAIHAGDIGLRRIHNIIINSGGESSTSGSFTYYEVELKSTELDVNAAEGSLDNYASLTARIAGVKGAGATLVMSSTSPAAGTHTVQFVAFGD